MVDVISLVVNDIVDVEDEQVSVVLVQAVSDTMDTYLEILYPMLDDSGSFHEGEFLVECAIRDARKFLNSEEGYGYFLGGTPIAFQGNLDYSILGLDSPLIM